MLTSLFSPLKIGPMEIANRVMMPGMSAGQILDERAFPLPEMIAYFAERAQAEPGLMAIGATQVVPPSGPFRQPVALFDPEVVEPLARVVEGVKQYDTKFGLQLWDGGTQGASRIQLSPSGISAHAQPVGDVRTRFELKALSIDEIAEVVGHFAAAAGHARQAGVDFVEIHAGHGYLISAFLSSYFNRREDRYGGSLDNRAHFLFEILAAVREAVGPQIGVGIKINGDDFFAEGGWTIDDAVALAPMLEARGADYLSVTAGVMGGTRLTVPPLYEKQGCFTDLAAAVRAVVSIPVATIGRIKDPVMADRLVAEGTADIVCMGRPMIADSQIVAKARRGELDDIRRCLADCRGCLDHEMRSIKKGQPGQVSCVVNPRMQRESVCVDIEGSAASNPKTVLVVGAGLAGLEAARRCAFSGHRVILCEARGRIGGQINWAKMVPGRSEIGDMLPWYARQISKYGVDLRLNTCVDMTMIEAIAPDILFITTGSVPQVPQNLTDLVTAAEGIDLVLADDLFEQVLPAGRNVLVIGGDQIGMQVADYLSESGAKVTVAEAQGHFAGKLAANDRWYLTARCIEKGVRRVKTVHDIRLDAAGLTLLSDVGETALGAIDQIVFASERHPLRDLAEGARSRGIETHVVGDAFDVNSEDGGMIFSTIARAYDVARRI
ncbi:oxidoreductase [Flavisphingomonas formosensis]|uniref:oxidoreductase n=1 Tax=Flavisphingomonas formosensis TaxID=861534 RepID=UPI0012F830BD|nr:FAD-dependent oxidoreductase [Sphingomonas formosensis]